MRPCAAKHLFLPILNTLDRLRGALLILWVCIGKQMLIHSFMVLVLKLGISVTEFLLAAWLVVFVLH